MTLAMTPGAADLCLIPAAHLRPPLPEAIEHAQFAHAVPATVFGLQQLIPGPQASVPSHPAAWTDAAPSACSTISPGVITKTFGPLSSTVNSSERL